MRVGALDHNGITEGSIWKPLLGFFFPIWMGTFFQQFYNTADAMIVGRFLGTSALAAVGATSSIVSLLVGFFVGLASGASVVIAQYYGARDRERLSASVHTAVILALVSGLFFMILGIGTARTILRIMQTPQDIMDDAMAYIRVYYMGMIPLMLSHGVGANGNSTLGSGVVGGMIVGTLALLFLVPTLFIVFQTLQEKIKPVEFTSPDWCIQAEIEENQKEPIDEEAKTDDDTK